MNYPTFNYPRYLNRHYLLMVKKNSETHLYEKMTAPIGLELNNERIALHALYKDSAKSVKDMLDYINSHNELKKAYNSFSNDALYNKLAVAFGGLNEFQYNAHGDQEAWGVRGEEVPATEQFKTDIKHKFFNLIFQHIIAYRRNLAICKWRQDSSVKIISHCSRGFHEERYKINQNIDIVLKTNFSYGQASYFGVILTYKGLRILPCQDLVVFHGIKTAMLMSFSASFPLEPNPRNAEQPWGWHAAIDFIITVANMAITNEKLFIEKYIVSPCEQMVQEFESWLYYDNMKDLSELREDRFHDFVIHAERISYSLKFPSDLLLFQEKNIPMQQFISRIEKVNQVLKRLIEKHMPDIIALTPKRHIITDLEQKQYALEAQKKTTKDENAIKNIEQDIKAIRRKIREQHRIIYSIESAQRSLERINSYFSARQ